MKTEDVGDTRDEEVFYPMYGNWLEDSSPHYKNILGIIPIWELDCILMKMGWVLVPKTFDNLPFYVFPFVFGTESVSPKNFSSIDPEQSVKDNSLDHLRRGNKFPQLLVRI